MLINKGNGGRLGNQMFAYAFGRLLAEQLGYESHYIACRKGTLFRITDFFPHATATKGRMIDGPGEIIVTDSASEWDAILAACENKRVIVRGHFQNSQYYMKFRRHLQEVFACAIDGAQRWKTVFHFRGTDFEGSFNEVSLQFYFKVWNSLGKPQNAIVVTDDVNYRLVREFCVRTGCLATSGDAMNDFVTMTNAEILVISRSSLAWWAAFLSEAHVICPAARTVEHNKARNLRVDLWTEVAW